MSRNFYKKFLLLIVFMDKFSGLTLTSRFHNKCSHCSKCCCDEEAIILSPVDLYKLSIYSQKDVPSVIQDMCLTGVHRKHKIPLISLKREANNCIYKDEENKCSLGEAIPYQCSIYPLIKEYKITQDKFVFKKSFNRKCNKLNKVTSLEVIENFLNQKDKKLREASDNWYKAFSELINISSQDNNSIQSFHKDILSEFNRAIFFILYKSIQTSSSLECFLGEIDEKYEIAKLALIDAKDLNHQYNLLKKKHISFFTRKRKKVEIEKYLEQQYLQKALVSYKTKYQCTDLQEIKSQKLFFK